MKKLLIIIASFLLLDTSYAQLFDATIDGAIPGIDKDVVAHYQKKGYSVAKYVAHSDDLIFMTGNIKLFDTDKQKRPVLIQLKKEDASNFVKSIEIQFMSDSEKDFELHKKIFSERFGKPSSVYNKRAVWQLHYYKYTIGFNEDGIYHELKVNKAL
ncbi:MAG: hypothetical protein ACK55K_07675 [Bacteroidota bacterium]